MKEGLILIVGAALSTMPNQVTTRVIYQNTKYGYVKNQNNRMDEIEKKIERLENK